MLNVRPYLIITMMSSLTTMHSIALETVAALADEEDLDLAMDLVDLAMDFK